VIAGMVYDVEPLTDAETQALLVAADLVTLSRTGVDYDYRGDVVDAHAPEMPTRFAKQLAQIVRGAVAIGADRRDALRLAIRCARDSMPPLRLSILDDVCAHPGSTATDVRRRLGKPRATVDRQLQSLHMLGVLAVDEEEVVLAGELRNRWRYGVANGIDPTALSPHALPDLLSWGDKGREVRGVYPPSHKSGDTTRTCCQPQCGYPLITDLERRIGACPQHAPNAYPRQGPRS
jgi:hypothetical protein